jgi:hypothetical protein
VPGNAVLSVGNLWGTPSRPGLVGFLWGRADALLSLLTMVQNRAVASATLGLSETASGCGHDLAGGVKGPPSHGQARLAT